MKALILSCGTGGGHNGAAQGLADAAGLLGMEAKVVDYLGLAGKISQQMLGASYVRVVQHTPELFGAAYTVAGKISSARRHSPIYAMNMLLARALENYLRENAWDVILCPHLYPAEACTYLKKAGALAQPVIAVSTDYTCIPFWEETRCDAYIAPHPECVGEQVRRGIPEKLIYPLGIPVRAQFSKTQDRTAARQALGLEESEKIYLVMGGSMGFGDIPALCQLLLEKAGPRDRIVALCGSRSEMREEMARRFRADQRVTALGYIDVPALYMAASDVLFTKPGGLSSTEAAAVGVPMVLTAPIPGCESRNRAFFMDHGMALGGDSVEEQALAGLRLAEDADLSARMRGRQRREIDARAAEKIMELAQKLGEKEPS